jgi:nicotinamide-nucleotide amidase
MEQLLSTAARVGELLKARGETVAVAESSTGGLISAALLAVPGASAFYMGGGVLYTARARHRLLGLGREDVEGMRSASPPYAMLLARTVRARLDVDWGIAETGASGPSGNPYGDAAGHTCLAVSGSSELDRYQNMLVFAESALALLEQALTA